MYNPDYTEAQSPFQARRTQYVQSGVEVANGAGDGVQMIQAVPRDFVGQVPSEILGLTYGQFTITVT